MSDVGRFFVIGPLRCCDKTQSFLLQNLSQGRVCADSWSPRDFHHFQCSKHFPRDHRLRLETPGCEVLDYEENILSPAEVERKREKIMRAPLVVRDREYPFSEDVIVDETGAVVPNLGVMAKVSLLIEVLRLGGNYELV